MSGKVTIIAEHEEGDVRVSVPATDRNGHSLETALGLASDMVAAAYRTYIDASAPAKEGES